MKPSRRTLSPREAATQVAGQLTDAGHETYFAGGCVRDRLLGLEPTDYDIATNARPDVVADIFPHARGVGAHFGVMLVPAGGHSIEVATFRSDGAYEDGRRPSEVIFGSAEADANRRDFTINGLFEHPHTGEVIDFVGGRSDLDARILRAIGAAEERIDEDRLRMLRAVRFAARFSLEVDSSTGTAITARADQLGGVSRERVGHELRRMLGDDSRAVAGALAESLGLDRSILGASRIEDGRARLEALSPGSDWIDGLAAWELDRGTADLGTSSHRLEEALILSNREKDDFIAILEIRAGILHQWAESSLAARKRLAGRPEFRRALVLAAIDEPRIASEVTAEFERFQHEGLSPDPLIGGHDLLEAGLKAGPRFKTILDATYDAQLEGRIRHRAEAIEYALRMDPNRGSEGR
ncbi:MAG: CCA tRNA nucleotidyltransferase [Phycisphaera sp.]|nr:CCA tRNA nucleotidyltransferase [Phycisphaera sp.]